MMAVKCDDRVAVRVDKDLKESSEKLFECLGLTMSAAINMFLRKAVSESAIPFEVSLKGSGSGTGYSSEALTNAFENAVRNEIVANQQKGNPIARYDAETKKAYLEYADGKREYINE